MSYYKIRELESEWTIHEQVFVLQQLLSNYNISGEHFHSVSGGLKFLFIHISNENYCNMASKSLR